MKKINLIYKIIMLSLASLLALSGCTNTQTSNTEDSNMEVLHTENDRNLIQLADRLNMILRAIHCIMNMVQNLKRSGKVKMET